MGKQKAKLEASAAKLAESEKINTLYRTMVAVVLNTIGAQAATKDTGAEDTGTEDPGDQGEEE